jgi:hypothetical protein
MVVCTVAEPPACASRLPAAPELCTTEVALQVGLLPRAAVIVLQASWAAADEKAARSTAAAGMGRVCCTTVVSVLGEAAGSREPLFWLFWPCSPGGAV